MSPKSQTLSKVHIIDRLFQFAAIYAFIAACRTAFRSCAAIYYLSVTDTLSHSGYIPLASCKRIFFAVFPFVLIGTVILPPVKSEEDIFFTETAARAPPASYTAVHSVTLPNDCGKFRFTEIPPDTCSADTIFAPSPTVITTFFSYVVLLFFAVRIVEYK